MDGWTYGWIDGRMNDRIILTGEHEIQNYANVQNYLYIYLKEVTLVLKIYI